MGWLVRLGKELIIVKFPCRNDEIVYAEKK